LIYTGRISQDKKVDKLFEIFYKLAETFTNIQLVIYGNGPDKNRLISQYGNDKRIIFGGLLNQDEMYTTYNSFSNPLFVFPSTYETLGKSPIEASLCGIPVFTAMSDETIFINIVRTVSFGKLRMSVANIFGNLCHMTTINK